jgi:hypothetical protein
LLPSLVQRPVKRGSAHVQKVGHVLTGFAFLDQLPGVVDLLGAQGSISAKNGHAETAKGLKNWRTRGRRKPASASETA